MDHIVPSFLISFFVTFSLIPVIISYVRKKNILDEPGGRKIHKEKIPAFGGIAIFLGFLASLPFWISMPELKELRYFLGALLLVFFVGIRDDLVPLPAKVKLVGQLIAAFVVVHFSGIRIESFYGLFMLDQMPVWLSYFITIFTIVVITNAFNLIDGVNGLAGTVATITFISLGLWFYLTGHHAYFMICVCMVGGIIAFLKYNYSPAKIFMGDTGSLVIGFMASVLTIVFIEKNKQMELGHVYRFNCEIASAVGMLIYPLADTLRVFTLRILQGKSPFSPDKSHLHHLVLRLGAGHMLTTFSLSIFHLLIIVLVVIFRYQNDVIMLPLVILVSFLMGIIIDYLLSKAYPKKTKKKKIFN